MEATTITPPNTEEIRKEHAGLIQRAREVSVVDETTHGLAQVLFKDLTRGERAIKERIRPIKEAAHQAHRGITSLEGDLLKPFLAGKAYVSRLMSGYEQEEREKARKAAAVLAAEEKKQREEEALEQAQALEDAGDTEAAEEVLETPIEKQIVHIDAPVAKVKGVAGRGTWKAEVTSLLDLVKHVAANPGDLNLLMANGSALNKLAAARDGKLGIKGVKTFKKFTHSARL